MSERLNIRVIYPLEHPEQLRIETDVKDELVAELVGEFLLTQVGAGEDPSKAEKRDTYTIHLQLDLNGDVWYCKHDCGNKGLRDGILMDVVRRLR
jgi:hypothetical protein